jgi:oxygen-independent coproporphyrinogen-3 oxidase
MASIDQSLSLYLHIPFCHRKCIYCDFYSIEDLSSEQRFIDSLISEIALKAQSHPSIIGRNISTIFFGGGTPSLLEPNDLQRIVAALKNTFLIGSDTEFTMECNPGTVTIEKLDGYRQLGVNRLSFGIQSFDEQELSFLSRIHTADESREAVRIARRAGFDNINADMMFALPHQTKQTLLHTLDEILALETEHISAYNLTIEEGTPLNRMVKLGQVGEMPVDEASELFELVQDTLSMAGYEQYEISNYALSSQLRCRHNLAYWSGYDEYVSFGPSAHEFISGMRAWNISSLEQYISMIAEGRLPRINSEHLTRSQRRTEILYCGLRAEGIDLNRFRTEFGEDLRDHPEFASLYDEQYVQLFEDMMYLTKKGYRFCDAIVLRLMTVSV